MLRRVLMDMCAHASRRRTNSADFRLPTRYPSTYTADRFSRFNGHPSIRKMMLLPLPAAATDAAAAAVAVSLMAICAGAWTDEGARVSRPANALPVDRPRAVRCARGRLTALPGPRPHARRRRVLVPGACTARLRQAGDRARAIDRAQFVNAAGHISTSRSLRL